MPNWCNNNVTIGHNDPAKLVALAEAVNSGKFCNFAIPVPEDLQITAGFLGNGDEQKQLELKEQANLAKYGHKNWYDFCVERWGTKWEVDAYEPTTVTSGVVEFGFDSAWAPPIGVYEELVEQGYTVRAYYYEPGMAYVGKWEDGIDECFEYGGYTSENVRELIGDELDEQFGISESMAEWEAEEANEED